jgi:hypothetical protein
MRREVPLRLPTFPPMYSRRSLAAIRYHGATDTSSSVTNASEGFRQSINRAITWNGWPRADGSDAQDPRDAREAERNAPYRMKF